MNTIQKTINKPVPIHISPRKYRLNQLFVLVLMVSVILFQGGGLFAISQSALDAINNNHPYYIPCSTQLSSPTSTDPAVSVKELTYKDPSNSREIPVTLYLPQGGSSIPILLFAPGRYADAREKPSDTAKASGTSNSGMYARYLKSVASKGFIVAGINYPGNNKLQTSQEVADTKFVISKLKSESSLTDRANTSQIGMFGHSDGGLVSAAIYGNDPDIKAQMILSAGGSTSSATGPPLLSIAGTKDQFGNYPSAMAANPSYGASVSLTNAMHDDYIRGGEFAPLLDSLTDAFFKRFLEGNGSDSTKLNGVIASNNKLATIQEKGTPTPAGSASNQAASSANSSSVCCGTGSGSGLSDGSLKAFMHQPITSTWGISENAVEQWFLKQTGARVAIAKYRLNADNIGAITAAVKAEGVSPVLFYSYTVNEGSTSGGFINHYSHEAPGGGVGNATTDAKYLADQSKKMGTKPSWIDVGTNKLDFVPKDIQEAGNADFQSMPSETIDRAYVPATAAAAWEVYYPDGLKKEFNKIQNYGSPLKAVIDNIEKMGGDPLQGGLILSSDSCSVTTGTGIAGAVSWAKAIANNDGYGYDQSTRTTGWTKWQSDQGCKDQCGSFDCSSLISAALTSAGYFNTNPNFNTGSEEQFLKQAGFTQIATSARTSDGLKPGDILVNKAQHTAMYIGDNKVVEATHNENHGTTGGKAGDQNGDEISINTFSDYPWDSVWRAPN